MLPDFGVVNLLQQLRVLIDEPRFPQDVGCCILDLQEESWLQVPSPAAPAHGISRRRCSGSAASCSFVSQCCKSTRPVPAGARCLALLPHGLLHLCKGSRAARTGARAARAARTERQVSAPQRAPPARPCSSAPPPGSPPRWKLYPKPREKEKNPELSWIPASICRCWQVPAGLPAGRHGFRRPPG